VIAERIAELGLVLPPVFAPAGSYLGCVIDDGVAYVGGHGPINGRDVIRGKVGGTVTFEQAKVAARMTALSILATLQAELGTLDRIERVLKVFGMVNVAPGFNQTPAVIDACSDLLIDVFGDKGRHTAALSDFPNCPSTSPSRSSSLLGFGNTDPTRRGVNRLTAPASRGADRSQGAAPDLSVGVDAIDGKRVGRTRCDRYPFWDCAPHWDTRLGPAGQRLVVVAGERPRRADHQTGWDPARDHLENSSGSRGLDAPDPGRDDHSGCSLQRLGEEPLLPGRSVHDSDVPVRHPLKGLDQQPVCGCFDDGHLLEPLVV
jgi:enamine deaminase RidA (YjgF/YER057c/UK114 family)